MATDRNSLEALRNLILEADLILETTPPLPQNRTAACRENLRAAVAIEDDLLKHRRMNAAAVLGSKGGSTTAGKLGSEHYKRMAAARKTHAGGRARKHTE
ncbi:MAG: hypothetical protein LAP38_25075 [Acidobacteriia bacterium]|nr:hypothetical protein [Terriglobia bacterium]